MRFKISREDLDYIEIGKLNLSIKTENAFRRSGCTTAGDVLYCADLMNAGVFLSHQISTEKVVNEILTSLIEYLCNNHSESSKLIGFNISHDALYYIGIEKLNLSVKTYNLFKRTGIDTVGDCLDVWQAFYPPIGSLRWNLIESLEDEVIPKTFEYLWDNHRVLA